MVVVVVVVVVVAVAVAVAVDVDVDVAFALLSSSRYPLPQPSMVSVIGLIVASLLLSCPHLLIIVTESWIGFSSLKTPLRDPRLPSSLLLPLETVLFRGCCKKKPEEPSQDSTTTAFLFSEGF